MHYTVEVEIDLPRNQVFELFDNTDNLYKWQEGLQYFEHLSGEAGRVGAKSNMRFRIGDREINLVETITLKRLPDRFDGTYETKGVFNIVKNTFRSEATDKTRWISENEFRFSGVMRITALMMKGAFRKQSLKYMRDFKAFAEHGTAVRGRRGFV